MLDRWVALTGRALSWLVTLLVLNTGLVVLLRYGFGIGNTALQELSTYLHASVFLLGAAWTLQRGGHVRVDIFYRNMSQRAKAWVNALGTLIFLLPLCIYILVVSWDFAAASWAIRETSSEPGGLPFVYLLKSLIPLMAINLALAAVAELLRSAMVLLTEPAQNSETADG